MHRRSGVEITVAVALVILSIILEAEPVAGQDPPGNRVMLPLLLSQHRVACLSQEVEPNDLAEQADLLSPLCRSTEIVGLTDPFVPDPKAVVPISAFNDIYRLELKSYASTLRFVADFASEQVAVDQELALYSKDHDRLVIAGRSLQRRSIQLTDIDAGTYYLGVFPQRNQGLVSSPYAISWQVSGTPLLLAPEDESLVVARDLKVTLNWQPVLADSYLIEISRHSDPHNGIWQQTFKADHPPFTPRAFPVPGEYWWRVQPVLDGEKTAASNEIMFYLCDQGSILNLESPNPKAYRVDCAIELDDLVYTDRDYQITSLPPSMAGLQWISSPNELASAADLDLLRFHLPVPAQVMVAVDPRQSRLPAWMDDFSRTTLHIGISDVDAGSLDVYRRHYPAGPVILGAVGAQPAEGVEGNDLVIIQPDAPQR